MELTVNQIFPTLLSIAGTLQNSDWASALDSVGETRTTEKQFLKMLQEKQALIRRIARLYCKNGEDQRDLFQEIVCYLWKGFPSYRGEASMRTWVYSVCLHTAVSRVRKKQLEWVALDDLPEESHPATRHDTDGQANLITILEGLPDVDKAIVFMMAEGYPYSELANILGIKLNTVMQRVHRLRVRLKGQLSL